jgi:DNA polymerase elongation subunit (family B)
MEKAKKMKKQIVYYITAKLYYDIDQDIDIEHRLDDLRGEGEAEVTDVKIEEVGA